MISQCNDQLQAVQMEFLKRKPSRQPQAPTRDPLACTGAAHPITNVGEKVNPVHFTQANTAHQRAIPSVINGKTIFPVCPPLLVAGRYEIQAVVQAIAGSTP